MTENRRADERVSINLRARCDGLSGAHEGRIEDLSLGGCFVNTAGRVDIGEVVVVEIKLPSGERLQLRGEITSSLITTESKPPTRMVRELTDLEGPFSGRWEHRETPLGLQRSLTTAAALA